MVRVRTQNRRFCGMRRPSGGKGVTPPSRRVLEGSLCKNLAMEISDWEEIFNGDLRLERDLQWRFAMEICNGDFQWRFAMEIFNGDFRLSFRA